MKMWKLYMPLFCLCIILQYKSTIGGRTKSDHEAQLLKQLLQNIRHSYHDRGGIRPVSNPNETVRVQFGLSLIQYQFTPAGPGFNNLEAMFYEKYSWKDSMLTWNPAEHGGVSVLRIEPQSIWKPDVAMYNSLDVDSARDETSRSLTLVTSDGSVLWIPRVKHRVTCPSHVADDGSFWGRRRTVIPCTFKFGSWTFDGFKIDIDFYSGLKDIDVSDLIPSSAIKLESHGAIKNVKYYPCCKEPYPNLEFQANFTLTT